MPSIRDVWLSANHVIRLSRQTINRQLQPLGLSSQEGNILLHMGVVSEPLYQDQLADQLDISKAAISRAVDSLVEKGYVMREKVLSDKRFSCLRLTEKAQSMGVQIEAIYENLYAGAIKGISENEFETLLIIMGQVAKNLGDLREGE